MASLAVFESACGGCMTPCRPAIPFVVPAGSHENGKLWSSLVILVVIIKVNSVIERQAIPCSRRQRHKPRRTAFGSALEVTLTAPHFYRTLQLDCSPVRQWDYFITFAAEVRF